MGGRVLEREKTSSHSCIHCPRTWNQASTSGGSGSGVVMANWGTQPPIETSSLGGCMSHIPSHQLTTHTVRNKSLIT